MPQRHTESPSKSARRYPPPPQKHEGAKCPADVQVGEIERAKPEQVFFKEDLQQHIMKHAYTQMHMIILSKVLMHE